MNAIESPAQLLHNDWLGTRTVNEWHSMCNCEIGLLFNYRRRLNLFSGDDNFISKLHAQASIESWTHHIYLQNVYERISHVNLLMEKLIESHKSFRFLRQFTFFPINSFFSFKNTELLSTLAFISSNYSLASGEQMNTVFTVSVRLSAVAGIRFSTFAFANTLNWRLNIVLPIKCIIKI